MVSSDQYYILNVILISIQLAVSSFKIVFFPFQKAQIKDFYLILDNVSPGVRHI